MRTYKKVQVDQDDTITCDRCGLFADCDDHEGSEFLSHGTVGGFDSVFSDGDWISIDLCQKCIKEVLGQWVRLNHKPYSAVETSPEYRCDYEGCLKTVARDGDLCERCTAILKDCP